ncbi:unnamed protein product [Rhizoctonia solani]|uniref:Uncharacterized protein n=1 Tax=Rhizoctonia solani TaxID=456999 RepID=A0A8H3CMV1_9AGAM|nr:unnamed protein product [Rhizoctonia solani]
MNHHTCFINTRLFLIGRPVIPVLIDSHVISSSAVCATFKARNETCEGTKGLIGCRCCVQAGVQCAGHLTTNARIPNPNMVGKIYPYQVPALAQMKFRILWPYPPTLRTELELRDLWGMVLQVLPLGVLTVCIGPQTFAFLNCRRMDSPTVRLFTMHALPSMLLNSFKLLSGAFLPLCQLQPARFPLLRQGVSVLV